MRCAKQDQNLRLSLSRRIFIFIMGFFDNMLFGGAVFGWPQLVYILKKDGLFSDLCGGGSEASEENLSAGTHPLYPLESRIIMGIDFTNISRCQAADEQNLIATNLTIEKVTSPVEWEQCAEQDQRFALIYTIAVLFYGVPGVGVGFLLHYAGLRITRLLGGLMVAASFLFFAFITQENPNWLIPATILLSVGGNQVRMSCMQFGDLFPRHRSTTITVLSGVYAASASLFLLFAIAQEHDVSLSLVSYCIGGFALVSTQFSLLMPPHHIPYEREAEEEAKVREATNSASSAPLWDSLNTLSSFLHLYWFIIMLLCTNSYQQFYNVWVTASTCTDEEAGLYSSFFSYSNLVSVFCAPVGGMFTDYLVIRAKKDNGDRLRFMTKEIQASFLPLFLTTLLALVMYGCLLFFIPAAVIISLICMVIVRPCIIAISTAYIRIRFPADHFNRLLGIYCTLASIMLYFQYPIFQWAQKMYYVAQGVIIALTALSFINPFHLLCSANVRNYVIQREGLHDEEAYLQHFVNS